MQKELMKKTLIIRTKFDTYNFEAKEDRSSKESEIMKCGWPAGTASLYDDEFMKDMKKSIKENKN